MKKPFSKSRALRDEEKARKKTRRLLVIFTLLFIPGAVLAFPPAMASIRMFDAHGATENPATILLFLSFFSLPAVLLTATILAWLFYVLENFRRAKRFLLLPLINVAAAALALAWLQIAYDGLFGGKP
jgi:uncharacterized BrkB/YihY/UPF0761 family membrane protein